jgi:Asp-tRNA(Asn)/Glu-tRNA(Gln) amidotransferase A subunit family amidase
VPVRTITIRDNVALRRKPRLRHRVVRRCGYNAGVNSALITLSRLHAALQSGEITPIAAVERHLARANSNVGRNVYIAIDRDRVLRDADEVARLFVGRAKPALYGLPISMKDCFDLQGFVTTAGTRFYAEHNAAAREDSAVAARLKEQGAVIVGKTHLHPLAYGITGENPDYGDETQPRDAKLLTGGSSSGAAASVQEGSAVAGIGTDTGGSVRVPAALCGLAGFRASIELAHARGLWRGGVHLSQSFDTLGWLFRDLSDGPLLASALFGLVIPSGISATAADRGTASSRAVVSLRPAEKVRIGVVSADFVADAEAVLMQRLADWTERLRDAGAEIFTFDASWWREAWGIYAPIQASEAAAIHAAATRGDYSVFEPRIAERLAWGASLPVSEVERFRSLHAAFRGRTDALLREFDFVMSPCSPVARLEAGADHTNARKAILSYTTPMSLAGAPVVTLPATNGAGVQLAAARGADARLLAFAARFGGQDSAG